METVIEWYLNVPIWQVFLVALGTFWFVGAIVRALWRWVARRRKAPKACPVCGNHEVPVGFADWEPWNKPASSCDVRYTCRCCGAEVWHEVAHDGKRAGWRCAPCLPARTLEPAPDRQYQGDQVTGIRKELLALEERVGKLERQPVDLNWPTLGNSFGIRFLTPNLSVGISSQPARYRVFRQGVEDPKLFWVSDGRDVWAYRDGAFVQRDPIADHESVTGWADLGMVSEVFDWHPEYRDVVASFEAWKAAQ